MNRPVGVCITQNLRNPRISSTYKLYAFYYFYSSAFCLSVSTKKTTKKCPNTFCNKKKIFNDKYINIDTQETDYSVSSSTNSF